MVGTEERLAHLEGLVSGHSQVLANLSDGVGRLERRMDRGFDHVEVRLTHMEGWFATVERRLTAIDQRIDGKFSALDASGHGIHGDEQRALDVDDDDAAVLLPHTSAGLVA